MTYFSAYISKRCKRISSADLVNVVEEQDEQDGKEEEEKDYMKKRKRGIKTTRKKTKSK